MEVNKGVHESYNQEIKHILIGEKVTTTSRARHNILLTASKLSTTSKERESLRHSSRLITRYTFATIMSQRTLIPPFHSLG